MVRVYEFSPRKKNVFLRYKLNTILIAINVVAFIIFTILISIGFLPIEYVAIQPLNILQGKYLWTFVTSMFMHGGFFHLLANMLSMFFIGSLVERIIGRKRYFWLYVGSGIFASLFFVLSTFIFVSDLTAFAVGASGALFGLLGLLVVVVPNLPVFILFVPIPIKMKYAAPGMLILLWLISLAGNIPVGNMAHLGGFLVGLFYGFYLRNRYKNKTLAISKFFS